MDSVTFPQCNKTFGLGGCNNLPGYNDGVMTITKWQLTPEELDELTKNEGCVYLVVHAGPSTPPVAVTAFTPFPELQGPESFAELAYSQVLAIHSGVTPPGLIIYNSQDAPGPKTLRIDGSLYARNFNMPPRQTMFPIVAPGSHYIRRVTEDEAKYFEDDVALVFVERNGDQTLHRIPQG